MPSPPLERASPLRSMCRPTSPRSTSPLLAPSSQRSAPSWRPSSTSSSPGRGSSHGRRSYRYSSGGRRDHRFAGQRRARRIRSTAAGDGGARPFFLLARTRGRPGGPLAQACPCRGGRGGEATARPLSLAVQAMIQLVTSRAKWSLLQSGNEPLDGPRASCHIAPCRKQARTQHRRARSGRRDAAARVVRDAESVLRSAHRTQVASKPRPRKGVPGLLRLGRRRRNRATAIGTGSQVHGLGQAPGRRST